MNQSPANTPSLKLPAAFLPLAMSLAGIAMVLGYVAMFGAGQHEGVVPHDEGAPARIFQLLMIAQLPIVAFFTYRWLPRAPMRTLLILALQAGAGIAAIATVIFFENS